MNIVQGSIFEYINELKEDFEIEEKMEFSKEHAIDQIMLLETESHQTQVLNMITGESKAEETKVEKKK